MNRPVDALTIAADGDDAAVKDVHEGTLSSGEDTVGPEGYGMVIHRAHAHRTQ